MSAYHRAVAGAAFTLLVAAQTAHADPIDDAEAALAAGDPCGAQSILDDAAALGFADPGLYERAHDGCDEEAEATRQEEAAAETERRRREQEAAEAEEEAAAETERRRREREAEEAEEEAAAETERLRREQEDAERQRVEEFEEFEEEAMSAAERREVASDLMREARRSGIQGDNEGAIRLLNEAADVNPEEARIYLMLYTNYSRIGDNPRAASTLREYLRRQPNDPNAPEYGEIIERLEGN